MTTQTQTKIKCEKCERILNPNLERFRLINKAIMIIKAKEIVIICPCGWENNVQNS